VASVGEGVAAGKAPEGQPRAAEPAVADNGDVGVLTTGRQIFALRDTKGVQEGRKGEFVEAK
jgi:hypothetical protein